MKTLYIRITSVSRPALAEIEGLTVLDCRQDESFCNYLGYELADGIKMNNVLCYQYMDPKELLLDFAEEKPEAYQNILYQWEAIQKQLLDKNPASEDEAMEIVMPQEYVEWLCKHTCTDRYRDYKGYACRQIGERLKVDNKLKFRVKELQEELIQPIEFKLKSFLQEHKGEFDRFAFSDRGLKNSAQIVNRIHEWDEKPVYYSLIGLVKEGIEKRRLRSDQDFTVNGVTFTMVYVKAGSFYMGSNESSDEKPIHLVTLSRDYYIGRFPVTQELWRAVMGADAICNFRGDKLPVESVSWEECQVFVQRLSQLTDRDFRLPTEAQWEFAARGGVESKGYKYAGSNNLDEVAWYTENSGGKTHEVGTKQPNELGIYDMSGNVWEWCLDWYSSSYPTASPVTDPKGSSSGNCRVYRGGSWGNLAAICRAAFRHYLTPSNRCSDLGLRLALAF